MPNIYATVGLPASGKSTHAAERCADGSGRRANRDDIRFELFGKYWGVNENKVSKRQDELVAEILAEGKDVWIDDTNLSPKAKQHCRDLADAHGVWLGWVDFTDVPMTECIKRDLKRDRSVGEDVIRGMWERYLKPPPLADNGKPRCITIDMDGTLAIHKGRSPFEWHRVGEDLPNKMVVDYAKRAPERIVIVSGRDGSCRAQTNNWLVKHGVPFVELLMRTPDDNRPDHIIKNELLDDLLTRWYPILAIDDRQQVVDNVWRARGIECWQVAAGRF
jgi:predicted kinase